MPKLAEMDLEALRNLAWDQPQRWPRPLRASSLLIAGVLSFLCTWSLGTSGSELELAARQAASLESGREQARLARSELGETQKRARELSTSIAVLRRDFLLVDELPELLDLLSGLCAERGVVIEALLVEDRQTMNLLDVQPLNVSLAGAYHQLGLLYEDLANLPWPVVVQEFEIQAEAEANDRLKLRLVLLVPLEHLTLEPEPPQLAAASSYGALAWC